MSTSMTGTVGKSDFKPALWTPGDWNALFGFGTNILVNMLVLTGLLRLVLKMPDMLVCPASACRRRTAKDQSLRREVQQPRRAA